MKKERVAAAVIFLSAMCIAGCGKNKAETAVTAAEEAAATEEQTVKEEPIIIVEDSAAIEEEEKEEPVDSDAKADELRKLLEDSLADGDGEILAFVCDDYDCDGAYEAFAFTGSVIAGDEEMPDEYNGELWFVNESGTSIVCDEDRCYSKVCTPVDFGKRKFLLQYEAYVTARVTHIYTVRDGLPVEEPLSGVGDMSSEPDGNDFTVTISAYDGMYDAEAGCCIGHTWKPYYYRYDESEDGFVEYEPYVISRDEADGLLPEGVLDEVESEGNVISEIMMRDNGILTADYSMSYDNGSESYGNVNYDTVKGRFIDVWGTGEDSWRASDFGGNYSR